MQQGLEYAAALDIPFVFSSNGYAQRISQLCWMFFLKIIDDPSFVRHFILDLAVRGKLVPQDPNDISPEVLVERIRKAQLSASKKGIIGRTTRMNPIAEEEKPFTIPKSWAWFRLSELGRLGGGFTPSTDREDYWGGDVPWVSPKDMKSAFIQDTALKVTGLAIEETRLQKYRRGSIIIVARSGILKRTLPVSISTVPCTTNQDMKVLVPWVPETSRYLQIMFWGLTDFILRDLVKTGTTVQSLKYQKFEIQPLPIPPLAEQHRIVAKVDELMNLCDRLDAQIDSTTGTRRRFLEATLHEALSRSAEN
jgi:type I restriction enzyme, S subunit